MIEFAEVTKTYGRKTAVDRLTMSVPAGELFALLGPNGAGKTTSIKMMVGLLRPTSGSVKVCGFDVVRQTREATRCAGYAPDEPYLYDKLTGREFLDFVGRMHGLSHVDAACGAQIEQFELADFVDELAENYSHGMKQRVALAAALLHDPEVLVIDEPMVGLDPRSTRLVKDLLRRRADAGKTVFMSTHTLALAEEIADRIGIVHRGRLQCLGTLDELRRRYSARPGNLERMFLDITADEESTAAEDGSPAESASPHPAAPR